MTRQTKQGVSDLSGKWAAATHQAVPNTHIGPKMTVSFGPDPSGTVQFVGVRDYLGMQYLTDEILIAFPAAKITPEASGGKGQSIEIPGADPIAWVRFLMRSGLGAVSVLFQQSLQNPDFASWAHKEMKQNEKADK